jgi:hypothetical protein
VNIIRDEVKFIATWDESGSFGLIHLSKAKLEELVISAGAGSHGGEHVTSNVNRRRFQLVSCVCRTVRSRTRLHNENERP